MRNDRAEICRVAAWNAEWAPPDGMRGRRVASLLGRLDAGVICLTEGHQDLLPVGGHVAVGQDHGGVPGIPDARRVLLWSRAPLGHVDPIGDPELPHHGFVRARTATAVGDVDVISVCIPWADAGVARFGGSSARWAQHEIYLGLLAPLIAERTMDRPIIVAGDFNQYIPRIWGPRRLSDLLASTLKGLAVATGGPFAGVGRHVIDHVAHSPELIAGDVAGWPGRTADGRPLSDHAGVRVDLRRRR